MGKITTVPFLFKFDDLFPASFLCQASFESESFNSTITQPTFLDAVKMQSHTSFLSYLSVSCVTHVTDCCLLWCLVHYSCAWNVYRNQISIKWPATSLVHTYPDLYWGIALKYLTCVVQTFLRTTQYRTNCLILTGLLGKYQSSAKEIRRASIKLMTNETVRCYSTQVTTTSTPTTTWRTKFDWEEEERRKASKWLVLWALGRSGNCR